MAFRSGFSSPRLSVSKALPYLIRQSWIWTEVLHHSKWQLDEWIQRLCITRTWKNGRMFSYEVVYILHVFEITGFLPWEQKKTLGRPSIKAAKWSNGNASEAGSFSNGVLKGFWKVPPTFLEILWRKLSTIKPWRGAQVGISKTVLFSRNMSHQKFPQSCVSIHHCHWTSVEKVCRTHRSNDIDPEPGWGQWCIRVWRICC